MRLDLRDHLGQLAGAVQDLKGLRARRVGAVVVALTLHLPRVATRFGAAQQLMGDLHRDLVLAGRGVLLHQAAEDIGLVSRLTTGSCEHRLGLLVHPELVHLLGERHLQRGVEAQAEQPVGGRSGAVDVAAVDRQTQGHHLALLKLGLIARRESIDQGECLRKLATLLVETGQLELELGVLGDLLDGVAECGEGLVLLIVPPVKVAESELPHLALIRRSLRVFQNGGECFGQDRSLFGLAVEGEHLTQHLNRRVIADIVRLREIELLAVLLPVDAPDGVIVLIAIRIRAASLLRSGGLCDGSRIARRDEVEIPLPQRKDSVQHVVPFGFLVRADAHRHQLGQNLGLVLRRRNVLRVIEVGRCR